MDVINLETNRIVRSAHTPGTDFANFPWVNVLVVDFSSMGVDIGTAAGRDGLRRIPASSFVIEDTGGQLTARWKTEDDLYDLEEARAAKFQELDVRLLQIFNERSIARLGANGHRIADLLDRLAGGNPVAGYGALGALRFDLGLPITTNDVVSQYLILVDQIEAAASKDDLDAITIP